MTYKEMCEVIEKSKILVRSDGSHPTAEEIFKYSPSGELFMVHEWYARAKGADDELRD